MQTTDEQTNNDPQNEASSPQAGRPDIQWMRGGNTLISSYGQPYFFADGLSFLTASEGEIKYWRTSDGVLLKSFKAVTAGLDISDYALSPNKQTIAIVGAGSNSLPALRFFNAADGSFLREISVSNTTGHVVFSHDSQNVASDSGGNGIIQLWRVSDGALLHTYQTATGQSGINFPTITGSPAISPNDQLITGTEANGSSLVIVRISDGSVVKNYNMNSSGAGNSRRAVFNPDGQYILTNQKNGAELAVFGLADPCTGSNCIPRIILIPAGTTTTYKNLAFSSDGTKLAVGGFASGQSVNLLYNTAGWSSGQNGFIRSYNSNNLAANAVVAFTPDGTGLLSQSYNMKLWNVADGSLIRNLDGHSAVLTAVAYSPNGQIIATTTNPATGSQDLLPGIYLWRASDGALLRTVDYGSPVNGGAASVAFSPDSQTIAVTGSGASIRNVKIFNVATGALVSTINGIGGVSVVFSPDGLTIATGDSGSSFSIHRISDGGLVRNFVNASPSPSFSPDGQRITDGKNIYRISDGATLFNLNTQNNPGYPNGAAYSPNGQFIATVSSFGSNSTNVVRLYNAATGAFLRELAGHTNTITTVAFSADSSTLFSGGNDATVRFWKVSDGSLLQTYDQETGTIGGTQIIGGAFSPDGQFFTYARSTDATVVLARNSFYTPVANSRTRFDFDGDSKADVSIFRPNTGEWWLLRSIDNQNRTFAFGSSSDKMVPADYTGDGKTDVAFWRPATGEWFILRSENFTYYAAPFGQAGDQPAPADFDADGKADLAVFRASSGQWFINLTSGGSRIVPFGQTGDVPEANDYDGDGRADIAIFRPSTGEWWLSRSTAGQIVYQFGASTDKPVPADYTGDGKTDVAFFRPAQGFWYILRSENNTYYGAPFGQSGDIPVAADYDGDGKADLGVFRPSDTNWYLNRTTAGFLQVQFGLATDKPVEAAFIP